MITAGVNVNCSLLLEPAHQLTFWLEPAHHHNNNVRNDNHTATPSVRATLKLTNISPTKRIVFKVRTNNAEMFTVKPVHGIVAPNEAVAVVVSLVPSAAAQLASTSPRALAVRDSERFLIQSLDYPDDRRGSINSTAAASANDLVAFWRRIPRELPVSSKIGCRFAVLPRGIDPHVLAVARRRLDDNALDTQHRQTSPAHSPAHLKSPSGADRTFDLRDALRQYRPQQQQQQQQQQPQPPLPHDRHSRHSRNSKTSSSSNDNHNDALEPAVPAFAAALDDYVTRDSDASSSSSESDVSVSPDYATPRPKRTKALFSIHPRGPLVFQIKPARSTRPAMLEPATCFLTNNARQFALAFKVKTTNHDGYFVKPSRGLIGPANAQRIDVVPVKTGTAATTIDNDATTRDLQQREANDRFLVEIVRIDMRTYQELLQFDDTGRKRELLRVWDDHADPSARERTMLSCVIQSKNDQAIGGGADSVGKHEAAAAIDGLHHKRGKNNSRHNNQEELDLWC